MVKDKYLKESLNAQRLSELASKYGLTNYMPGQSFDSVKDKMSAEDYETSNKLLNYYTSQESITDDYNYNNNIIEQNQKKTLQENAISKELAMKYLPEHLKLQGMGGLGVSESAVISANNDFRNARNTINADAESRKNELLKNYQDNMRNLDNDATIETTNIAKKYEDEMVSEKNTLFDNFNNKLDYGEFNNTEELEKSFNLIKDKLTPTQQHVLQERIDYYKNNLAQKEIDKEYEMQNEQTDNIISGKEYVSYNGQDYQLNKEIVRDSDYMNILYENSDALLGTNNPYSNEIKNGTTITIKDILKESIRKEKGMTKSEFEKFYEDNGGDESISRLISSSYDYQNFPSFTYYNGSWYESKRR